MLSPAAPQISALDLSTPKDATAETNNQVLAIGSLSTAAEGKYQTLISSLNSSAVEKQMLDRLVDGGTFLKPFIFMEYV